MKNDKLLIIIFLLLLIILYKFFYTSEPFFDFHNIPTTYNYQVTDIENSPIKGIPKIIHHICPKDFKKWHNKWFIGYESSLRAFPSPEYTHMYWYDDELHLFIESEYPWFLDIFN